MGKDGPNAALVGNRVEEQVRTVVKLYDGYIIEHSEGSTRRFDVFAVLTRGLGMKPEAAEYWLDTLGV